jgi:hypothetical protein
MERRNTLILLLPGSSIQCKCLKITQKLLLLRPIGDGALVSVKQ